MMKLFIHACFRLFISAVPFLFSNNLYTQLVVDETVTKDSLATLITGNGVAISNVIQLSTAVDMEAMRQM